MRMTDSERVLLALIKNTLFGTREEYPADADWDEVFKEAQQQSVARLIANALPKEYGAAKQYRSPMPYIVYLQHQERLITLLTSKRIPMAVLKGAAAAVYYPLPSLRTFGDIDFIVPQDRFDETRRLLLENGYSVTDKEDNSNDRHVGYQKDGMRYELHRHFSHDDFKLETYVIEGLNCLETANIDGFDVPMLPKLANGLVLLDHMRSHLRSGLGLRQAIDWMMYVYRELDDQFWNESFHKAAADNGLETLAITITRMCQIYLGLPETAAWCRSADKPLCEGLMENLLSTGNFGKKRGNGKDVETVLTAFRREGLFSYLQCAGESNWKAYHRHKCLKPFCWFYQIFRYARQGIEADRGKRLGQDMDRGKERYELLKRLKID